MPFGVSMIWREPTNHDNDCYFCMTIVRGCNKKTKHKIVRSSLPSALRPRLYSVDIPLPTPPAALNESDSSLESMDSHSDHDDQQEVPDV